MSHNFKIFKGADNWQSMIFKQNRWYLSFFGLYEKRDFKCLHYAEQKERQEMMLCVAWVTF